MTDLNCKRNSKIFTKIYFGMGAILIILEFFKFSDVLLFIKPLLIPVLIVLYYCTSNYRNIWYMLSLVFALASNIFFLSTKADFLLYGMIAFMIYRILSIVTVIKVGDTVFLLAATLATFPFLFIILYLVNLIVNMSSPSFYPSIINGIFISIFNGIAVSNYFMNDNKQNSWLFIFHQISHDLIPHRHNRDGGGD